MTLQFEGNGVRFGAAFMDRCATMERTPMKPTTFAPFDLLDYLRTPEERAEFLEAALEMDDEAYLAHAREKIREAEERYPQLTR